MRIFSFETNIAYCVPGTTKVYAVNRMTSDYAAQHPFDVDGFIDSVYQEFTGTAFEESRETLERLWKAVMSDRNPRGDASLYPNNNGACRAAAMKIWHKAGDYWRRGLRQGDILPALVPMHTITRLDDGSWIALFPKDMHLLESEIENESANEIANEIASESTETEVTASTEPLSETVIEPVRNQEDSKNLFAAVSIMMAATVALVVIYETGLLIPLGLIGLITGGILK